MNYENILEKIKRAAQEDQEKKLNPAYNRVIGFLVKKGFLYNNTDFKELKIAKLLLDEAVWVGKNIEPRVLEVLPALAVRLPKELIFKKNENLNILNGAKKALLTHGKNGPDFFGVPYKKYKVWMNLPLRDGRTKPANSIKKMKSFRLSPRALDIIEQRKKETGMSASEILENLLLNLKATD